MTKSMLLCLFDPRPACLAAGMDRSSDPSVGKKVAASTTGL